MRVRRVIRRTLGLAFLVAVTSAHIGSPDVFFQGRAGPYDIRVTIRPPEVVPGIARVTVRAPADVQRVSIRPVFWRAGSKGAPSADDTRRMAGDSGGGTFQGALWLMARGAYSVDVAVEGAAGSATVSIPVASVATGRLGMSPALGALLLALGIMLCAGLVNIVYKSAGESLLRASDDMDPRRRGRARRAAAIAVPIIALGLLGGARWWGAVDRDYERTMYRPSPLALQLQGDVLRLAAVDTLWQTPQRPSPLVPDHGKLMHLFLVRGDDARAFAHLHPHPEDTSAVPAFFVRVPPLPAGSYHVYGDVVHETGFERTLVGSLELAGSRPPTPGAASVPADPDDAWFVGDATREKRATLADGSVMALELDPDGLVIAQREETIRVTVQDPSGAPARLEPYLGMLGHGVVTRVDGGVYVHLHPMGTITVAAQDALRARDQGDTTAQGKLVMQDHSMHAIAGVPAAPGPVGATVDFPYAFPTSGSYRLFVQVKRNDRILTGAFAITVAEPVGSAR